MLHLLRVAVIADLNGRAVFRHGEPVLYIKRHIAFVFGHTLNIQVADGCILWKLLWYLFVLNYTKYRDTDLKSLVNQNGFIFSGQDFWMNQK